MPWVRLKLELITPCFLAGAAGAESTPQELQSEGLRPPSLIGPWRYWLRAALGSDTNRTWQAREADLFGSQHGGGRQGRVAIRPRASNLQVVPKDTSLRNLTSGEDYSDLMFKEGDNPIDPLGYLLGQGLFNFRTGLTRPAFKAGQTAQVDVTIRGGDERDWHDLRYALWLWQTFGGLGARSRRGWGSVQIASMDGLEAIPAGERSHWKEWFAGARRWDGPTRDVELQRFLSINGNQGTRDQELAFTGNGTNPDQPTSARSHTGNSSFSHVGAACAVLRNPQKQKAKHWSVALAELGSAMLTIRSNVHGRERPTDQLRVRDHDAVVAMLFNRRQPTTAPYRAAFGLPHNYFFAGRTGGNAQFEGSSRGKARRASPVMLHVARHLDEKNQAFFLPLTLWFKSNLVPPRDNVVNARTGTRVPPPDWSAVVAFLREFYDPGNQEQGRVE